MPMPPMTELVTALLANNLLADSKAAGRLRYIPVGIRRFYAHSNRSPVLTPGRSGERGSKLRGGVA